MPDGIFQKPIPLLCGEMVLKQGDKKTGRRLIPTRCGVTMERLPHNKFRAPCHWCSTTDAAARNSKGEMVLIYARIYRVHHLEAKPQPQLNPASA